MITVKKESFDSVASFVATINSRETNEAFAKYNIESSRTGSYQFTQTKSMEEANELLTQGYPKGMKAILDAKTNIKVVSPDPKPSTTLGVVGHRPCVARAIAGVPNNMYRRVQAPLVTPVIKIYYDPCASHKVKAGTLATGGKNLMTLIQALEGKGIRVDLHLVKVTCDAPYKNSGNVIMLDIKIKSSQTPVTPLLLSYPLTHPSFFRRHLFRWEETSEITSTGTDFWVCYGYPCRNIYGNEGTMKMLREHNVMSKDGYYLNCLDCASATSIDEMLKVMGYTK